MLTTLCAGTTLLAQERLIETGHYDLGIDYLPGEGWRSYVFDYVTASQLDAVTTVYRIGESARAQVPTNPDYALLGKPGDPVWIIPEIYNPNIVYLGVGAPLLGRNIFTGGLSNRGRINMRLLDLSGSGPEAGGTLTMWKSGFPPSFIFSSADGIGPEDALNEITANFHAHYNWAFTQPGVYRVTFAYSGTLQPQHGGSETSTEVTFTFDIDEDPVSWPLRYAWPLGEGWAWSSWMGMVYTAYAPWVWNDRYGWLYLAPSSLENIWLWSFDTGWVWTNQYTYPWLHRTSDGQWLYQ